MQFKYGQQIELPSAAAADLGTIYLTTDTAKMYITFDNLEYVTLGNFIAKNSLDELQNLPDTSKTANVLYMVIDDNNSILYRYNNNEFIPILDTNLNLLPTVTADDVGKFLRVNSAGFWSAETILNAEEVLF